MQQGVQERVSRCNKGYRRGSAKATRGAGTGSIRGIGGGGDGKQKEQGVQERIRRRNRGCGRGGPAEATICRNMQSLQATTLVAALSGGSGTVQLM